ncbi:hypothetical protein AAHA92_06028 [Salvia divinorum]|uniref:Uncharacterized protein n=1 Tax=Salvia divinorum TaxID=28513 RepID=A0ABD1I4C2_SALDI
MIGLLKFPVFLTKKGAARTNRWSDCGCQSCLSWITHSTLHLLVKEQQRDKEEEEETINEGENSGKNEIFIHVDLLGFGRSPKPEDCLYTLTNHVEMIERTVIVPFELDSFHLVAHSMAPVSHPRLLRLGKSSLLFSKPLLFSSCPRPYFSASSGDPTAQALKRIAARRVWPSLLFFSAFMSWYEHLGRCMCFLLCRNHRLWEWILMLVTRRRDLHFLVTDVMRHTHHSAWHTMHNVVCGGARFLDSYMEVLRAAGEEG